MKTVRQSHCSLSHFPEPLFLPSPLHPFHYFTSPSSYISLLLCRSFTIRTHPCHSLISLSLKKPPFSSCTTVAPSIPIPPPPPPKTLPRVPPSIQSQDRPHLTKTIHPLCRFRLKNVPNRHRCLLNLSRRNFGLSCSSCPLHDTAFEVHVSFSARVRFCWEGRSGSGSVGA